AELNRKPLVREVVGQRPETSPTGAVHGPHGLEVEARATRACHELEVRCSVVPPDDELYGRLPAAPTLPAEAAPDLADDVVVVRRIVPTEPFEAHVDPLAGFRRLVGRGFGRRGRRGLLAGLRRALRRRLARLGRCRLGL